MTSKRFENLGRVVWTPALLCVVLVILYFIGQDMLGIQYQAITENMFIMAVLVLGTQMFSGNSGVLSFGHVSFMAIGAYTSALLTIPPLTKKATLNSMPGFLHWILNTNIGTLEATLIGGAVAAIFGLIVAAPIVRLAGVPAGIATLALLVIVYTFNIQTTSITGGSSTMIGVPETTTTFSALVWALIATVAAFAFQASGRGMRLRASRENEPAARSVGINVPVERGVAWVVSAFFMGIGGALYGHYIIAFGADDFYVNMTFTTLLMLVIGGLTSVSGAVTGTVFITIIQEALRRFENGPLNGSLPGVTELVLAAILILLLILRPRGLTAGHEIPWPTQWRLPWRHGSERPGPSAAGSPVEDASIGDASGQERPAEQRAAR